MNVEARVFDKIAIFRISGEVTAADAADLDAALSSAMTRLVGVMLSFEAAKLEKEAVAAFVALRQRIASARFFFLLISPSLAEAEFKDIAAALNAVNSPDSARIAGIHLREKKQVELQAKLRAIEVAISKCLRSALSIPSDGADAEQPLSTEDTALAEAKISEKNKKLEHLFKVLKSDADVLRGQQVSVAASSPPESEAKLEKLKRQVSDTMVAIEVFHV